VSQIGRRYGNIPPPEVMDAAGGSEVHARGRCPRRRRLWRAALLACLLGAGACRTPPSRAALSTRASAEHATRSGEWRAAADRWYELFLAGDGADAKPCLETARALIELGDGQSAAGILEVGLAHHPDDPDLLEMKGDALVASGFRLAAEAWYERALGQDPGRVSCLRSLARQRMALGKESAAVHPLQRIIELGGEDLETWLLLAKAQQADGELVAAYDAWCHALTLGEAGIPDVLQAALLCLEGSVREARPEAMRHCTGWLEHAVERDPQCTRAHFQLGVLYERSGEIDKAVGSYRRAIETDPACLMALTNLAILYSTTGDEAGTREMVDLALRLETDDGRRHALVRLLERFDGDADEE
jgi:Flp pilus assembly protein TadD